jgi:glutamyl-Q tRNA(Asp) synthetase
VSFVTRFAPSPTGLLHRGHAFSALTAWTAARAAGGRFLLRIEDTDFTRCRPEYETALIEDLRWLGLDWDGPVMRQSERRPAYDAALDRLREMGVLYRCFRTRKELMALAGGAPHADDPAEGKPFAWRLSLAAARDRLGGFDRLTWVEETSDPGVRTARPEALGDMVVGRKDIGAGYVIASVVDDADQGVTHVIRGEDLIQTTSIQRVLQALLDLPTPVYRHHRLLLGPDGKRYAKRDGSVTLMALREAGVTARELRAELGFA